MLGFFSDFMIMGSYSSVYKSFNELNRLFYSHVAIVNKSIIW